MAQKTKKEQAIGALAFWLILIAVALVPLLWLQVWAYQNLNMKAFVVGNIFIIFIILTFAFDFNKHMYPEKSTFSQNALSFSLGCLLGTGLGWLTSINQSLFGVFTVSQQYLLSEVTAQLPLFWSTFANTIGAPVAEEMLFLITIPVILFTVMHYAGTKIKLFKNPLLQVMVVAGVAGPLFAFFHVGNVALMGFIISAILFRVMAVVFVHGDVKSNILPVVTIIPSFGVGYHASNNIMASGGWEFFVNTMMLEVFGWLVLIVFAVFFIAGTYAVVDRFILKRGKKK